MHHRKINRSRLTPGAQLWAAVILVLSGLWATAPSWALGPVDGEIGLQWWSNNFSVDVSEGETSGGAFGGHAEVWWQDKWGLKGSLYRSDLDETGIESADHLSIDVKRRLFSLTDNSFVAVGLGWEDIDLVDGTNSSGARLLLEGRVGVVGALYLYGQTAWFPSLDDAGQRTDLNGNEYEAGLSYDPFPFLSLRAGYRRFKLDFDDDTGSGVSTETRGFIFGAGLHW